MKMTSENDATNVLQFPKAIFFEILLSDHHHRYAMGVNHLLCSHRAVKYYVQLELEANFRSLFWIGIFFFASPEQFIKCPDTEFRIRFHLFGGEAHFSASEMRHLIFSVYIN